MALKLLTRKDAPVKNEEMGIEVRFGRLMPEHIAIVQGLMQTAETRTVSAVKVGTFALREMISELSVRGEKHDPLALGFNIDTRDPDNVVFLMGITIMIVNELIVTDEAKKKPTAQPALSGEVNDAPAA